MRLLELKDNGDFGLTKDILYDVQPYAILSHTWGGDDEEVTYQDMIRGTGKTKAGYKKIRFCIGQAARDGLRHCWVDTCCINKADSTELTEAINSMFRWYRSAKKCYVYLSDVVTDGCDLATTIWQSAFRSSRWFTRGWTLQELIAPSTVKFFCSNGHFLGDKISLEQPLCQITGIAPLALRGAPLSSFSTDERFMWAKNRQTKREEDKVYSLLGIFDIYMPLIYGEGRENASRRLQESISSARKHHVNADTTSSPTQSDPRKRQKVSHHHASHDSVDDSTRSLPSGLLCYDEHLQSREHKSPPDTVHGIRADTKQSLIDQLYFDKIDERLTSLTPAQGTTCRWFLKSAEYLSWNDMTQDADHGGLLWIKGNPGIGKSTLMKFLFEEARRKARGDASQITLSFFFLARGTDLEKSVIGLYRSLLHQLFEKAPQLKESLEWMTSDGARVIERTGWHKETLKQTLAHAVQSLGGQSFTVFVDALDECDEDEVADMVFFFEGLCDCARDAKVRLQVCFSSRHYPTIVIQRGIEIVLEDQTGHTADIEQYIKSKLRLGKSKAAEELRSRILEKSSNIFLWVVLVLDILNSEYPNSSISLKKAQERLNQIPPKLSELFEMILERDGQNREQLQLCLKWILFATRPLKPPELYFAVQLGLDKSSSGHWDPDDVDPDQINTFVRSSSKGLAEVTRNKASEVQFIHESVRDFLLGKYAGQSPEASSNFIGHSHEILKDCCIAQLSTRAGNCTVIPEPLPKARETAELREKICSDHPFLEYAVINVYRHANGAQQNEIEQENFLAHFNRIRWILLNNVLEKFDSKRYTGSASLLYLLAERDLDALIRIHPQGSSFLVEEGERYGVPLLAAVANGSNKAVKTFLELKAKSRCQKSRLHAIYEDYCTDSAGQLLPSRNFTYSRRRGVLSYLVEYGSTRLVEFVLTTGECNLKLPDHDELPKLSSAVQQDPDTLAQLLPDGQDQTEVNHEVEEHDNQLPFYRRRRIGPDPPLWCTIKARKYSMTKLLLDAGVDTEVKNFAGRLPLSEAVINNDEVLTKLLLEAGADKEGGDRTDGRTPLLWATYYGYEAIVKLLLETGVDTEGEDANGQIPLILAIENGQENIVRLLIQANADLEGKGTNGQTPLVLAVEKGQESIARLLIKAEADVEAKDAHGRTALLAAAQYDREISARLLLEVGADIEGRDSFGRTSLLRATEYKSEAVLKLLLKAGADMEVRDSTSQTPLLIAAYWRNGCGAAQAIVKPLLDSGADMEARDSSGQTPLSRAAHCGNEAIVKLLLEAGADMEARDLSGQTPLSRAAYFGIEATVELLLEAGAEIEAEDNNGQTPLSLALRETCNATVIMLLLQAYRNRGISNLEPLLLFAKEGNVHMVSVFLEEGANPSVKDEFGRTPIWYAHMNNFKRIVRMLLDAGASREEMEG